MILVPKFSWNIYQNYGNNLKIHSNFKFIEYGHGFVIEPMMRRNFWIYQLCKESRIKMGKISNVQIGSVKNILYS